MKVRDLLRVLDPQMKVDVVITAYGMYFGSSRCEDLDTVQDCLDHLTYDAKLAKVTRCKEDRWSTGHRLHIIAEVCK